MTGFELKEAKTELEFVKDRFYDFPKETSVSNSINNIQNAIKSIEELEEYYAIGTVEECREAREKQRGKKPVYRSIFTDGTRLLGCPVCFSRIDGGVFYCNGCGQKLDWSDTP